MVIRKRVAGLIEYNDGEFADVQIVGIEGLEKGLLLERVQLHREDTEDSPYGDPIRSSGLPFPTQCTQPELFGQRHRDMVVGLRRSLVSVVRHK
jgi:hypothetical protein